MKKILLTLACAAGVLSMSAQRASDSVSTFFDSSKPEKLVNFGVRAGLNVSGFTGDIGEILDESRCGFVGGVSVDFALMRSLYINSGVLFAMQGAKYEGVTYDGNNLKYTATPMYIKIPVMASYRYNFTDNLQWQLNFGPYFAVGVGGKLKAEMAGEKDDFDFFGGGLESDPATGETHLGESGFGGKRFDMGLGIGTGIVWNKIFLGLEYDFGLTKVVSHTGGKNRNFSVSAGYNF